MRLGAKLKKALPQDKEKIGPWITAFDTEYASVTPDTFAKMAQRADELDRLIVVPELESAAKLEAAAAPAMTIEALTAGEVTAGGMVQFRAQLSGVPRAMRLFVWDFGDGGDEQEVRSEDNTVTITHPFTDHGDRQVSVRVNTSPPLSATTRVRVFPRVSAAADRILEMVRRNDDKVWLLSALLATATGMLALYDGKPFGTLEQITFTCSRSG